MDEIIAAIINGADIEKQAAGFSALTKKEKLTVLEQVKDVRSEALGRFLNTVYPVEEDKEILKTIRKSLFRLKSAGIGVAEPKAAGAPVLRRVEEAREHKGFLSNYDDGGTRIILLVFGIKKNNFVFLNAVSHFSSGLLELNTAPVDRHDRDMIISEYRHGTSQQIVFMEISPRYASLLIEEASVRSGKFIEEMKQMNLFNERLTGSVQKIDDIYNLIVPEGIETLSPEKIFGHDIFASFKVTWETIDNDRKEYAGAGISTIVLPPYMAEEKKREFIKALIARDPLKSYVPHMKRAMEDYAYLFHVMNNFPCYKGMIEYLKDTNSPQEALSLFVKKSLEEPEAKPRDGLIVNPYGTVRP